MGRRAHGGAHHGQLGAVEQLAAESNALRPRGGGHASVRGRAPLSHGPHRKASRSSSTGPPAAVVCAMLRCGEARTRTRQLAVAASSSPLSASLSTLTGVSVFCVWCSSRSVVWVAGGASWRCPRTHDFAHRLSEVNASQALTSMRPTTVLALWVGMLLLLPPTSLPHAAATVPHSHQSRAHQLPPAPTSPTNVLCCCPRCLGPVVLW